MTTVKEVRVLNIDNVPYSVDDLSPEIQALVGLFNKANQKAADVQDKANEELGLIAAAKEFYLQQITVQFRADQTKAAEAAAAQVDVDASVAANDDTVVN